jgi:hypothetical protein
MPLPNPLRFLSRLPVTLALCLPLALLAGLLQLASVVARSSLIELMTEDTKAAPAFKREGMAELITNSCDLASIVAAIFLGIAILGLVKKQTVLWLIRQGYILIYDTLIYYVYVVLTVTDKIATTQTVIDGLSPSGDRVFIWYCKYLAPVFALLILSARFHLNAYRRNAVNAYTGSSIETPAFGDRIVAFINGWLRDRQARGVGASVAMHCAIFLFPLLMQLAGAVTPYLVPQGKGSPDAGGGAKKKAATGGPAQKKTVKAKIKINKPTRKLTGLVFSPDAGKTVTAAGRAESLVEELDTITELTYKADTNVVIGGTGTGTGGGTGPGNKAGGIGKGGIGPGGWPDGMANAVVRFVRLEYNGVGWDDGMSSNDNADVNFLNEIHSVTGFKVAAKGESHPIRLLTKYDKGFAPAFVYMTGDAGINVSAGEIKILRDYLMEDGMLFADCSTPEWDRSFRSFANQLIPGKTLVDISDDDPIYQAPYAFPNGAPPLWHHGGSRAMGIKHNGRWIVFYHPGDVNDAWKTGHSGLTPELAKVAFQIGINIVYYAFTKHLEEIAKHRK